MNTTTDKSIISRYQLMNKGNVIFGFLLLALLLFHPVFKSVVFTLLAIGVYFLLQISPVIIIWQLLERSEIRKHYDQGTFAFTNVIHPFIVGMAIILFFLYLVKSLIGWDGSVNTQLLQMVIFIGVNVFWVCILAFISLKIKRTSGQERQELIEGFSKAAPLFTYLSIGISIYHFGKMLIFNFELNEFRPVMMSIALMAVGIAMITTIMPNIETDIVKRKEE